MPKPIFVLLHGAWHSPQCWHHLVSELGREGFESVTPSLPSSGSDPPTLDWSQDVQKIRQTISELVRDRDVVVVMHSFSGMTGGTALEGLDKASCAGKGLFGGVVKLVYIAAFIVPEGFQHSPQGTRNNMVPEMKTDLESGIVTVREEDAKNMFYQDIDDGSVAELVRDLRPQSLGSFWSITTFAAWRFIATTYILCTSDRPSTVAAAEYLIETAKASGQHRIEKVIAVDCGHSPFISRPQWLCRTLIEESIGCTQLRQE
ncbi:alpha/beta-hydrolase [Aaosphaeria arxii CBS 175.79]|uniref:Alpha/beta-hydrolase n=1 Tax=Aaosphaeria arxii CBS 175.79 TaxID=1450172 RepID=A0A6A5XHS2_9PLEO|nr:alpha/beta-hydrolase [Aaosphaeria arxii CBS 175.79]KAF2012419.1 alpha/beta-hydrolase [Aaosphaeria arxii CBS 175.79]